MEEGIDSFFVLGPASHTTWGSGLNALWSDKSPWSQRHADKLRCTSSCL